MRKLLLFLLICQYSLGQITLTPNSVGMNSTAENNVLTAQGNGLLVQKKYTLATNNSINISNLSCPSSPYLTSLSGIIKDPNGDLNYLGGIPYNCNMSVYPSPSPSNLIGFKLTFQILDLGIGDTLFIYAGEIIKLTGNSPVSPILLNRNWDAGIDFGIKFKTNTDANVGQGFEIKYEAILEDLSSNDVKGAIGDNSLIFDTKKGSLNAGKLYIQEKNGEYSIGLGYHARSTGNNSISIGHRCLASNHNSVAIGYENRSLGQYSFSFGIFNTASGTQSMGLGNANYSNGFNSVSIGYSNQSLAYGSIALGNHLVSKSYTGIALGNNNNRSDNPNPNIHSSIDRIFQLGNGNSSIESNALTILRNSNAGFGNSAIALSPDSRLVIDGFTRLGIDAPKIKMKEISGNMPALNANNSYPHGLTDSKILSITFSAEVNNQFIPPNYAGNPSLEYNYYWTAGSLYILNKNGNSAGLVGVPFKALITYKE
jgi:hypothetical protein